MMHHAGLAWLLAIVASTAAAQPLRLHPANPRYFDRLRADGLNGTRGFAGPLYQESMWAVSPMNPVNNVNGFPAIPRDAVLTLDRSGPLLAVQEAVAARVKAGGFGFDGPRRDAAPTASATLDVMLPAGRWAGSWIDPVTGAVLDTVLLREHRGGVAALTPPAWTDDLALDLRRFVTP